MSDFIEMCTRGDETRCDVIVMVESVGYYLGLDLVEVFGSST